jgi:hypothetical protein
MEWFNVRPRVMLMCGSILVFGVAVGVGYVLTKAPDDAAHHRGNGVNSSVMNERISASQNALSDASNLIGNSQRLADILAYSWIKSGRTVIHNDDLNLLRAARNEIEMDANSMQVTALMRQSGIYNYGITESDGSFDIFGKLKLNFNVGSVFEDGIGDSSMFLPGEVLRMPPCAQGTAPVIFQAEATPINAAPLGLKLEAQSPIGYRVTVPDLTPQSMQYRLVVKASCASDKALKNLK